MFGQEWDKAEATIAARDAKFTGDGSVATYTYVADVRLASGEIFRATVKEPTIATDFWAPSIGDAVSVLVRPKDRKVKFDKDDDRLSVKAYHAAKKQAFEQAQQQPPGTPVAGWPSLAPSAQLPDGIAEKLAQLGISTDVPIQVVGGDSAQAQAILAAFTQHGAPASPTAEHTPEARLAKLQTMQASGLITAEEYADQRQRILDEI